jgi:hypothetical protein
MIIIKKKLTRVDDAINENIAWYQAVIILVHLAEQICEARFFVVHEFQELCLKMRRRINNVNE